MWWPSTFWDWALLLRAQINSFFLGWRDPGRRHPGYRWHGGGRQELLKDSLHCTKDLVSWLLCHIDIYSWHPLDGAGTVMEVLYMCWTNSHWRSSSYPTDQWCWCFFCSCCGAGVAADAEITTQIMASNVELHELNTGRPPLVAMVTRQLKQMLFRWVIKQCRVYSEFIVSHILLVIHFCFLHVCVKDFALQLGEYIKLFHEIFYLQKIFLTILTWLSR